MSDPSSLIVFIRTHGLVVYFNGVVDITRLEADEIDKSLTEVGAALRLDFQLAPIA